MIIIYLLRFIIYYYLLLFIIIYYYYLLFIITIHYNLLRFIINYKPNYLLPIGGPSLIPSHCHSLKIRSLSNPSTDLPKPTRNDDGPANPSKPPHKVVGE